jgi:hypothetical protein
MRPMWYLPNLMSLLSVVAGTLLITIGAVGWLFSRPYMDAM